MTAPARSAHTCGAASTACATSVRCSSPRGCWHSSRQRGESLVDEERGDELVALLRGMRVVAGQQVPGSLAAVRTVERAVEVGARDLVRLRHLAEHGVPDVVLD